ncbi:hypothetical protein AB4Z54_67005, partial [Streptomyces sp. MCAF7]
MTVEVVDARRVTAVVAVPAGDQVEGSAAAEGTAQKTASTAVAHARAAAKHRLDKAHTVGRVGEVPRAPL